MAIVTFDEAGSFPARTAGRFRRLLRRLTAEREARVERRVDDYLFLLDDARLATFAMSQKTKSSRFNRNFPW